MLKCSVERLFSLTTDELPVRSLLRCISADCSEDNADNKFKCVPGRWIVPIGQTLFLLCGIILLINLLIATFKLVIPSPFAYF